MKNKTILFFLLFIIFILILALFKSCQKVDEQTSIITAQNDVMRSYTDSEGRNVVERQVVEAGFEAMRKYYGDSIKKLIDANTVSLTRVKTRTSNEHTTATTIRNARRDSTSNGGQENILLPTNESSSTGTFREDSTGVLPIYETVFTDKWQTYSITAGSDSIKLQHVSYNEYSIKTEFVRKGKGLKAFFQPKVLQVSITNENPHTQTVGVDSWHVPMQKKYTGVKVVGVFILGMVVGKAIN